MTPLVRTCQAKTLKVHMISDVCYTPWPVFPADTSEHLSDPQHAPSGPATSSNHASPHCRAPVYSVMHLLVMPSLMCSHLASSSHASVALHANRNVAPPFKHELRDLLARLRRVDATKHTHEPAATDMLHNACVVAHG